MVQEVQKLLNKLPPLPCNYFSVQKPSQLKAMNRLWNKPHTTLIARVLADCAVGKGNSYL